MLNQAATTLARFVFGGAPSPVESPASGAPSSTDEHSLVTVSTTPRSPDKGVEESLLALVLAPEPREPVNRTEGWAGAARGADDAVGRRVRDLVTAATPRIWRDLEDAAAALALAPRREDTVPSPMTRETPWQKLREACNGARSSLGTPVSGVRTVRVGEKRSRAEGTSIEIQELSARQGGRCALELAGRATESRTRPVRKRARKPSPRFARRCGLPLCYCGVPAAALATPKVYGTKAPPQR